MKTHNRITLILLALIALLAQAAEPELSEIDLSDVVVIEDISTADELGVVDTVEVLEAVAPVVTVDLPVDLPVELVAGVSEVVEIPDAPADGIVVDVEVPEIPAVQTTALPSDSEIVLELPGMEEGLGAVTMAEEDTISVDFPDEDVRTILRNVADLFDLNVVIPDALQGRTSVKLRNITWRQVFEVVLKQQSYTYIEDRNIIEIVSMEELTTEPVDTRVFILNYSRASELLGSINPLIDTAAGGRIQVDGRSNALVITERPSRMNKIQEIIERLDKATSQVMIESKFIEVTNSDIRDVGVDWASLSGYELSAGPFQRDWSRERTTSNTGTGTSTINDGFSNVGGVVSDDLTGFDSITNNVAGTSRLDQAVFSADQFRLVISALNQKDDIKLVSNPTVVTLDNTQAKISIGERYPIPSYTFNAETGQRQLDEIEYEDIGINLDVTPQVNSAGFINLKILPEVSSFERFAQVEGTDIPIIESRRTESTIMIKDGYTLAIGGLSENSVADRSNSVPILGDLPGIGRFFSSDSDSISQRNLIIFITAKTLNPDGSTYRDIIDPRVLNQMGVVEADVPGFAIPDEDLTTFRHIEAIRAETRRNEAMAKSRSELKAIQRANKQVQREAGKLVEDVTVSVGASEAQ